ncbi:serine/threonine protein kinase [Planctopirus hydrillae]|uniref:Protein kinase domain-containing protein n=1 Tax=Planctopirus hydrillae TaxID=1841610 RepID=A0A1C3EKF9_9PLAN|nr:serine/threonine-protein kinase [Planctopirus hydrillae]ODA33715.1 hypothetical protein A6X21_18485 [Planctopirus hydrillae]
MPLKVHELIDQMFQAGLITSSDQSELLDEARFPTAEHICRYLVKQGRLTAFQAQQCFAGKASQLVLGKYLLLEKLGQGGMGTVYKAQHTRMKRLVAIKVVSANLVKSDELRERFQREVEAAARLTHPNIVQAFDADEVRRLNFLVMEYVEGKDLQSKVSAAGPMPLETALDLICQTARGLEYAHQHGIVHRDIKPANILIDSHGCVKILDLGLARFTQESEARTDLTSTGTVMGTVDYMAPEQAENTKSVGPPADIYSLGCTLYYLLTGNTLYPGNSIIQRLVAHREAQIPSMIDKGLDVPQEVDQVFRKMVAKLPEDRYANMQEVIQAIENLGYLKSSKHATYVQRSSSTTTIGSTTGTGDTNPTKVETPFPIAEKTISNGEEPVESATTETILVHQVATLIGTDFPQEPSLIRPKRPKAKSRLPHGLKMMGGAALAGVLLIGLIWMALPKPKPVITALQSAENSSRSGTNSNPVEPVDKTSSTTTPETLQPITTVEQGYQFTGMGDRLEIPSLRLDESEPLTFEAWLDLPEFFPFSPADLMVIPGRTATGEPIERIVRFVFWDQPANGAAFRGRLHCDRRFVGGHLYDGVEISRYRSQKIHLAVVFTPELTNVFINGLQMAKSSTSQWHDNKGKPFFDGITCVGGGKEHMQTSQVRLYSCRFSNSARYRESFEPPAQFANDPSTLAYYELPAVASGQIEDLSGHHHHARLIPPNPMYRLPTEIAKQVISEGGFVDVIEPANPGTPFKADQVAKLPKLPFLLNAIEVSASDRTFSNNLVLLQQLKRFSDLRIPVDGLRLKDLKDLKHLNDLKFIYLRNSALTFTELRELAERFPALDMIVFNPLPASQHSLESWKNWKRLPVIQLPGVDLKSPRLDEIFALPQLREVRFYLDDISDLGDVERFYRVNPGLRITNWRKLVGVPPAIKEMESLVRSGWYGDMESKVKLKFPDAFTTLNSLTYVKSPTFREISRKEMASAIVVFFQAHDFNAADSRFEKGAGEEFRDLRSVSSMDLTRSNIGDETLQALCELRSLESLNLSSTQIQWATPLASGVFPRLKKLNLSNTDLNPLAWKNISQFPLLEVLDVSDSSFDDAALLEVSQSQSLQMIVAWQTRLTNAGINAALKSRPGLTVITRLQPFSTPDEAAAFLVLRHGGEVDLEMPDGSKVKVRSSANLPPVPYVLREVRLRDKLSFSDPHMPVLSQAKKIRHLEIAGLTGISDRALDEILNLKELEQLWVDQTSITSQGVAQLAKLTKLYRLAVTDSQLPAESGTLLAKFPALTYLTLCDVPSASRVIEAVKAKNLKTLSIIRYIDGQPSVELVEALKPFHSQCQVSFDYKPVTVSK